ncbi:hypothetical protein MN608_02223 [Microdochium nivale]|nr:hypothetical protein MN608_02223 [Microdochium nivale]
MFSRKRQRPNPSAASDGAGLQGSAAPTAVASQASARASDLSRAPTSASSVSVATAPPALTIADSPAHTLSSQQTYSTVSVASITARAKTESPSAKAVRKTRSWYGSWPRIPKPQPSTQVAHETAVTETLRAGHTPDYTRFSLPTATPESLDEATQLGPNTTTNTATPEQARAEFSAKSTPTSGSQAEQPAVESIQGAASTANEPQSITVTVPSSSTEAAASSRTWRGWLAWTAPAAEVVDSGNIMPDSDQPKDPAAQTLGETADEIDSNTKVMEQGAAHQMPQETNPSTQAVGSWFGFWTSNSTIQPVEDKADAGEQDPPLVSEVPPMDLPIPVSSTANQPAVGSTWAFWSRETGKPDSANARKSTVQGEIAVRGDECETSPRKVDDPHSGHNAAAVTGAAVKSAKSSSITRVLAPKRSKRLRPDASDTDETSAIPRKLSQSDSSSIKGATTVPAVSSVQPLRPETPSKTLPANLVIPSFKQTYRLKDNPSVIKQIAQFLLRTQQNPAKHVYLSKEHLKIRKAVAIGVHGWFPASYLRPMIGQPTGTSIRFMNHSADAIRKWAEAHGCGDCEIEKIALEGDGKISDRVDNLWKLLLGWIDHIRRADLIILACHSQGVPVGLMLVAKLIELGVVGNARIGVCAMAGVCLGPFADYKAGMGMLMGTAAELWEFGDAESEMSKRLERALQVVLDFGGRVTFVGSIDDQVVPLDSAVYSPAMHPHIFRAVFIDGQLHASDFIAHLIGFALKLRNLGISDHGLIRELSLPLAGSLYSGEGHSRLYDDQQVYDLSVVHALETSSVPQTSCHFEKRTPVSKQPNPYLLPWIMRGLLEEDFVKTELSGETTELLRQYDAWEPSTKPLKDVKWRLEAVRSKL